MFRSQIGRPHAANQSATRTHLFMKKVSTWLAAILLSAGVVMPTLMPVAANAQSVNLWGDEYSVSNDVGYEAFENIGMGRRDPRKIIAGVIQVLLGFLGVIAVVLILAGGFKWMTANGNDAAIGKAKQTMIAGAVGLLIVLAAFGVSLFVTNAWLGVTGANYDTGTYQTE